jgi:Ca-activated chloride channel homolog
MMAKELTLKARFDRPLALDRGGSYRYLVVDIEAPREDSPNRNTRGPLNLALVIDRSGSMNGRPLEAAREAATGVVDGLADDDYLSVVVFDSDVETLVQGVRMDEQGRKLARQAIARIETRGTTDLSGGWLQGAEHVAERMIGLEGGHHHVIVLSDGMANRGILDTGVLSEYARGLLERGIQTSTVGIGDGYSPEVLQVLAEHGGGRMHDAEHPAEIVEVVLAELGEIRDIWASRLALNLSCSEGASVLSLSNDPVSGETSATTTFLLGSIMAGGQRRAVIQVVCPRARSGDQLVVDLEIAFEREGKANTVVTTARLDYAPSDLVVGQERDIEVTGVVATVWQSRLAREITRINIVRNYDALKDLVRGEFKYFRRYCSGLLDGPDLVRNVDRLLHRARRPMNERSRKEIALSTTKSMRGDADYRSVARESWEAYIDR